MVLHLGRAEEWQSFYRQWMHSPTLHSLERTPQVYVLLFEVPNGISTAKVLSISNHPLSSQWLLLLDVRKSLRKQSSFWIDCIPHLRRWMCGSECCAQTPRLTTILYVDLMKSVIVVGSIWRKPFTTNYIDEDQHDSGVFLGLSIVK